MGAYLGILFLKPPASPLRTTKYEEVPLPQIMHITLKMEEISDKQIVIVGDVHGCLEELKELVQIIQNKYGENCLYIFVGDIINKGPFNHETLHYVRKLHNYSVRGNHEERVIKEWMSLQLGHMQDFSPSYTWMKNLSKDDMDYLIEMPYTICIPALNIRIVHAGLSPWKDLNSQSPTHMVTMRNITGIDTLEPTEYDKWDKGVPWASVWPGPEHVIFGHDAQRKLQKYDYATGLDTGCLYGGALTAVNVTSAWTYFSVKAHKMHVVPSLKKNEKEMA